MVTETETQTKTVTEKTKGITQKSQIQVKKTNANKRTFRITSTLKDSRRTRHEQRSVFGRTLKQLIEGGFSLQYWSSSVWPTP